MAVKHVVPHLVIKGASDAIKFYTEAFGAVELARMAGPDGQRLMHAEMNFGPVRVMLADEFPEMGGALSPATAGGASVVLHLDVDDCDAAFGQAVAAGATVVMPPTDMFWGDRYSQVVDPFGHRWSIAHRIANLSYGEMAEAGEKFFAEAGDDLCAEPATQSQSQS